MKKQVNIFLAILLMAATFTSCKKEFLERPPEGQLNEDEAIFDEASLQSFVAGTYRMTCFDIYSGHLSFIQDLMADQVNGVLYSEDFGEIFNRKTSIFGAYKNDRYNNIYKVISRTNKIIEKLNLATNTKSTIEGQAKFLRALSHFEAVKLWGQPFGQTTDNSHLGVPVRAGVGFDPLNRATVASVYNTIIQDLISAETLLPATAVVGYPSKNSAKALLAKVYFQQNNFAQAFTLANQVITSGAYTFDNSVSKRFSEGQSTEYIFGWRYQLNILETGGELRSRYRSDQAFSPQGKFKVTDLMYNLGTQPGDSRAAWYTKVSGYNAITKYDRDRFDMPVIHLTELKLIRAEAGAETGGANLAVAITDVNDIISRAYGNNSQNIPNNSTAAEVIAAARKQRELEMIGEGNRLQEIKRIGARTGTSIDRRGSRWDCPGMVLQFPQGERAGNTQFTMNPEGGCN